MSSHHDNVGHSQSKFKYLPLSTSGPLECALRGTMLLNHPYFNKGSAFTAEERRDFQLSGLLPQGVQTLEQQVKRAYEQYSARPDNLAKNTFLTSMKEQNEVLYFRVRFTLGYSKENVTNHIRVLLISSCSITSRRCLALCIHQPRVLPSRTTRGCFGDRRACSSTSMTPVESVMTCRSGARQMTSITLWLPVSVPGLGTVGSIS